MVALIKGLAWRSGWIREPNLRPARINGALGAVLDGPDGASTIAFEVTEPGRIGAIYIVRNPDKLRGL